MGFRKKFEQFRYLRSFRVLLFSLVVIVFSVIELFNNYTRNENKNCKSGLVTDVKYSKRKGKSRTVTIHDIIIFLDKDEYKQGFVEEKEFERIKSLINKGDSIKICYNEEQVLEIISNDRKIYDSSFSNLAIIAVLMIGLMMLIIVIYYQIKHRDDMNP